MRKNILILVFSVVLLAFLNSDSDSILFTNDVDFSTDLIPDLSFIGVFSDLFTKSELDSYLLKNLESDTMSIGIISDNILEDSQIVMEESDQLVLDNVLDDIDIIEDTGQLISDDISGDLESVEEYMPPNKVIFRVQLGAFKKPLADKKFFGVEPLISVTGKDGLIRYMAGSFTDYGDASSYQVQMQSRGFEDCYVVLDDNGKIHKHIVSASMHELEDVVLEKNDSIKEDVFAAEVVEQAEELIARNDADKSETSSIKQRIDKPFVKESFKEDPLPSDKDIIRQHPNIKDNAKELILEALEEGDVMITDIFDLLNEYAGETINKRKVKKLLRKSSR